MDTNTVKVWEGYVERTGTDLTVDPTYRCKLESASARLLPLGWCCATWAERVKGKGERIRRETMGWLGPRRGRCGEGVGGSTRPTAMLAQVGVKEGEGQAGWLWPLG